MPVIVSIIIITKIICKYSLYYKTPKKNPLNFDFLIEIFVRAQTMSSQKAHIAVKVGENRHSFSMLRFFLYYRLLLITSKSLLISNNFFFFARISYRITY